MRAQCTPGKQDKADVSSQRRPHRAQPLAALEDLVTGDARGRSVCERKNRQHAPLAFSSGEALLSMRMPTGIGSCPDTAEQVQGWSGSCKVVSPPLNLPVGARACLCLEQSVSNDGDICTALRVG